MTKLIHVAVGVIQNNRGEILIAKRPQDAHQGGLWEFPGGKVDAGETLAKALVRELHEELAIVVERSEPLIQIRHHYPDKSVLLDVHRVTQFSGEPKGAEGQPVCWVATKDLGNFEFPAANRPIISAIRLSDRFAITGEFSNEPVFIAKLENALARGVQLVQLRLPEFDPEIHQSLIRRTVELTSRYNARWVINTSVEKFFQLQGMFPQQPIGLHLNRHEARKLSARPVAANQLLGVSCHNAEEILHAQAIGADYLFISPVQATLSHPEAEPLGWQQFSFLAELANIPVFALGGMTEGDLPRAKLAGAQGVAAIRCWWE